VIIISTASTTEPGIHVRLNENSSYCKVGWPLEAADKPPIITGTAPNLPQVPSPSQNTNNSPNNWGYQEPRANKRRMVFIQKCIRPNTPSHQAWPCMTHHSSWQAAKDERRQVATAAAAAAAAAWGCKRRPAQPARDELAGREEQCSAALRPVREHASKAVQQPSSTQPSSTQPSNQQLCMPEPNARNTD
jgi:hypothetical protein